MACRTNAGACQCRMVFVRLFKALPAIGSRPITTEKFSFHTPVACDLLP